MGEKKLAVDAALRAMKLSLYHFFLRLKQVPHQNA